MTTESGKKFDPCEAMNLAQGSHQVASATSLLVCSMLKGEKRAKCLEQQEKISKAAGAVLDIATTVIKACKL
jgi:hypothetical protein